MYKKIFTPISLLLCCLILSSCLSPSSSQKDSEKTLNAPKSTSLPKSDTEDKISDKNNLETSKPETTPISDKQNNDKIIEQNNQEFDGKKILIGEWAEIETRIESIKADEKNDLEAKTSTKYTTRLQLHDDNTFEWYLDDHYDKNNVRRGTFTTDFNVYIADPTKNMHGIDFIVNYTEWIDDGKNRDINGDDRKYTLLFIPEKGTYAIYMETMNDVILVDKIAK